MSTGRDSDLRFQEEILQRCLAPSSENTMLFAISDEGNWDHLFVKDRLLDTFTLKILLALYWVFSTRHAVQANAD